MESGEKLLGVHDMSDLLMELSVHEVELPISDAEGMFREKCFGGRAFQSVTTKTTVS